MASVKHRFIDHSINPLTEILVIGTFNPDTKDNKADFFYGRGRNHLWTLIPRAFGHPSLKGKEKSEKMNFIKYQKIDFIDLIAQVEAEEESNYDDRYIDNKVTEWRNVKAELDRLKNLRKVCLTRKTLTDIPNMRIKVNELAEYCERRNISFQLLTTPARFYRNDKQEEWSEFFSK